MADQADVARAILDAVEAVREALDAGWSTYRGWPEAAALDKELAAGDVHVTVNPRSGGYTRNTTRYLQRDLTVIHPAPTLTVSVAGDVATFAGTADPGQAAGVQAGADAWVVRTAAGSTSASIAASLSVIVPGATAQGTALTVLGLVTARIGADAETATVVRSTEQQFTVTVWCADPDTRDAVAAALDAALTGLTFLVLPDNEVGRIRFAGDQSSDKAESANLYTRMLHYGVDYPTTLRTVAPVVLFPGVRVNVWEYRPRGDGVAVTAMLLANAPPSAGSYATTIRTDGIHSIFTVQHPLNSTDVEIVVQDPLDGNAEVPGLDKRAPTPAAIEIEFGAPPPANTPFRILIART